MKKIKNIILILTISLSLVACTNNDTSITSNESKSIDITIIDESSGSENILFDETIDASSSNNLYEVLENNKDKIQMSGKVEEYGFALYELMGVECNWEKGPWWIYSSDNNETCVKMGMCPVMEEIIVKDKDKFIFKLTSNI